MEFDNIETIKQAVQIGAGVSILPEPTVRQSDQPASLAIVRLIAPELRRPIGIIHRLRKVFTPTAGKFVELLQQVQAQRRGGSLMRETEVPVTFQSLEKTVYVLPGTKLLEAAAAAELVLASPCGGQAVCGKCRVVVAGAVPEPTAAGAAILHRRGVAGRLPAGMSMFGPGAD